MSLETNRHQHHTPSNRHRVIQRQPPDIDHHNFARDVLLGSGPAGVWSFNIALQLDFGHESGSRRKIPKIQHRPRPLALEAFERQYPNNRNAAIQAAFATGAYTMAQLAQHFELHYTSVSRSVKSV